MVRFGSRHMLAALAMVMMGVSGGGAHAAGSGHDGWAGAPVACLPDRAQRWNNDSEMQPCHCPPQDYCPSDNVSIPLEDIHFSVTAGGRTFIIKATETTIKSSEELFKLTRRQLFALLKDIIFEKTAVDVNNLPRVGRGNCPIDPNLNPDLYKAAAEDGGCVPAVSITLYITKIPSSLEPWIQDRLKLPLMLASRCCDNICPVGFVPKVEKIEVPKPRDPNEGIRMSRDDITTMQNDLDEIKVDLQRERDLATQIAHATSLNTAIDNYLGIFPPTLEIIQALDAALAAFDSSINVDKVPNRIKTKYADLLGKVDALLLQTGQEIDLLSRPVEMITIDGLTCSAVRFYPREGCLIAGTKITLADGSTKPIEKLTLEDVVKGNHGPAKIIAINQFTQHEEELYSINDGEAFFTVEHPVLTPKGWKSVNSKITSFQSDAVNAGTLVVGDTILMEGGKELVVKSITKQTVPGGKAAFNLSVEGDGSFIANGFIMKGFKKVQVHY